MNNLKDDYKNKLLNLSLNGWNMIVTANSMVIMVFSVLLAIQNNKISDFMFMLFAFSIIITFSSIVMIIYNIFSIKNFYYKLGVMTIDEHFIIKKEQINKEARLFRLRTVFEKISIMVLCVNLLLLVIFTLNCTSAYWRLSERNRDQINTGRELTVQPQINKK